MFVRRSKASCLCVFVLFAVALGALGCTAEPGEDQDSEQGTQAYGTTSACKTRCAFLPYGRGGVAYFQYAKDSWSSNNTCRPWKDSFRALTVTDPINPSSPRVEDAQRMCEAAWASDRTPECVSSGAPQIQMTCKDPQNDSSGRPIPHSGTVFNREFIPSANCWLETPATFVHAVPGQSPSCP